MGIILFDIDGTLFDPRGFGKLYREGLTNVLGIQDEALAAAIADYYSTLEISTDFDPNAFIPYLAQRFGVEKKVVEDVFWNPKYFKASRFEDAENALASAAKENTLGVFSQGLRYYQEYKLEHSGLTKYFDPSLVFIYKRKMANEASEAIPQGAKIIEDKHDVALALSKTTKVVWLNRLSQENDPEMKTIHSLRQLTID